ncbi:MAG: BatA domain-containing protein, partial [Ignavibacteriaceae bacterium]|nr:BatA domain-containing protein [Ignavibacteriaceae bacterium]
MFGNVTFAYPWVLYFLSIIPLMIAWYIYKGRKNQASITYSSFTIIDKVPKTWRERLRYIPTALRLIALTA